MFFILGFFQSVSEAPDGRTSSCRFTGNAYQRSKGLIPFGKARKTEHRRCAPRALFILMNKN